MRQKMFFFVYNKITILVQKKLKTIFFLHFKNKLAVAIIQTKSMQTKIEFF